MSTGIPRTYQKVTKAARELGYHFEYATGGHHFYVKDNPDEKLGQVKKLTIPTEIKGIKTLYNILDGMGYFEAHGLGHDGQRRVDRINPEQERQIRRREDATALSLTREWKKAMKQFNRGILPKPPGNYPARTGPAPANTP